MHRVYCNSYVIWLSQLDLIALTKHSHRLSDCDFDIFDCEARRTICCTDMHTAQVAATRHGVELPANYLP